MKTLFCLLSLLVYAMLCAGQDRRLPIILLNQLPSEGLEIANAVYLLEDKTQKLDLEAVQKIAFVQKNKKRLFRGIYWVKFAIKNQSSLPQDLILDMGKPLFIDLYVCDREHKLLLHQEGGMLVRWKSDRINGLGIPIKVSAHQQLEVYVRIGQVDFTKNKNTLPIKLFEKIQYDNRQFEQFWGKNILFAFYSITLGFLFFAIVYALIQFVMFKQNLEYLYYVLVSILSFGSIVRVAEYHLEIQLISNYLTGFFGMVYVLNFFISGCYLLFISAILDLKNQTLMLYHWARRITVYSLILGFIVLYLTYTSVVKKQFWVDGALLISFINIFFAMASLLITLIAFYKKMPLSRYITAGYLVFYTGFIITFFINRTQPANVYTGFWNTASVYMCMGIVGELVFFLMALSRRYQWLRLEKIKVEFEKIQTTKDLYAITVMNERLEKEVTLRTADLQQALDEVQTAFARGQTTERKRVSADLHDEIGAALSAIAIYSDVTKRKAQKLAPALVSELERIGVQSRNMMQTMRDTIWALNDDSTQSVWERMYVFSLEVLKAKDIQLDWQVNMDDTLPHLSFIERRNLFLAYKEAINNIVKHAEATIVSVGLSVPNDEYMVKKDFTVSNAQCQITIFDNGKGFDLVRVSKDGNGLQNFENRMKEIGGRVQIESTVGLGTKLIFIIPT